LGEASVHRLLTSPGARLQRLFHSCNGSATALQRLVFA
jgi:hypothetical protein